MRTLLLPMMPQFPWAGSASRPDPRGDLTGCSVKSFPHSSPKQISASRVPCLPLSGLQRYMTGEEGNHRPRGWLCPILSSCDWPFAASWEPLPSIFTREQSLHHWFVHFRLASNTHCRQGPGNTGVKDTESLPSGSSCSSEGKSWWTDYPRMGS